MATKPAHSSPADRRVRSYRGGSTASRGRTRAMELVACPTSLSSPLRAYASANATCRPTRSERPSISSVAPLAGRRKLTLISIEEKPTPAGSWLWTAQPRGRVEQRAEHSAVDQAKRVVGRFVGRAAEDRHSVANRHEVRSDELGERWWWHLAVDDRLEEIAAGHGRRSSARDRRVEPSHVLRAGRTPAAPIVAHAPASTFWSLTWPRATSLRSSGRRISTCHNCCVRP